MFSRKFPTFVTAFLIVVLSAISSSGQQTTNKQSIKGKLVEVKINAPSLKGNLLGDPTEQNVSVYLPPSYTRSVSLPFLARFSQGGSDRFCHQLFIQRMHRGKVKEIALLRRRAG